MLSTMNTINRFLRPFSIVCILLAGTLACGSGSGQSNSNQTTVDDYFQYRTFCTDAGWGYEILVNEVVFIHQQIIPAIQGNHSFQTEDEARKTAELVVRQLKKNESPSVTVAQLDSLRVSYQRF